MFSTSTSLQLGMGNIAVLVEAHQFRCGLGTQCPVYAWGGRGSVHNRNPGFKARFVAKVYPG